MRSNDIIICFCNATLIIFIKNINDLYIVDVDKTKNNNQ